MECSRLHSRSCQQAFLAIKYACKKKEELSEVWGHKTYEENMKSKHAEPFFSDVDIQET